MNLAEWILEERPLADRLRVVETLCAALAGAGRMGRGGLLDPTRIQVSPDGTCRVREGSTSSFDVGYRAPETIGRGAPSLRADVFVVGVLAYQVLSGQHPYGGADPEPDTRPPALRDLVPDLPADLSDAVMACVDQDPEWRAKDVTYLHTVARATREAGVTETPGTARPVPSRSTDSTLVPSGRTDSTMITAHEPTAETSEMPPSADSTLVPTEPALPAVAARADSTLITETKEPAPDEPFYVAPATVVPTSGDPTLVPGARSTPPAAGASSDPAGTATLPLGASVSTLGPAPSAQGAVALSDPGPATLSTPPPPRRPKPEPEPERPTLSSPPLGSQMEARRSAPPSASAAKPATTGEIAWPKGIAPDPDPVPPSRAAAVVAEPPRPVPPPPARASRGPAVALLSVAALAAAAGVVWWQSSRGSPPGGPVADADPSAAPAGTSGSSLAPAPVGEETTVVPPKSDMKASGRQPSPSPRAGAPLPAPPAGVAAPGVTPAPRGTPVAPAPRGTPPPGSEAAAGTAPLTTLSAALAPLEGLPGTPPTTAAAAPPPPTVADAPAEPVVVTNLAPPTVQRGGTRAIDVVGTGFRPGLRAEIWQAGVPVGGATVVGLKYVNSEKLLVMVRVDPEILPGKYQFILADPSGQEARAKVLMITK